jgi:hypothetical protein
MSATRRLPSLGSRSGEATGRPVLGSGLLIVAGLLVVLVTWQFTLELLLIGGAFTAIGFAWGALMILSGALALSNPELSTPIGAAGVVFSILSIVGALGGMLVGIILGMAGGSLLIAWQPEATARRESTTETTSASRRPSTTSQQGSFSWEQGSTGSATRTELGERAEQTETERTAEVDTPTTGSDDDSFSWQQDAGHGKPTSSPPARDRSRDESPTADASGSDYSFGNVPSESPATSPSADDEAAADDEEEEDDEELSWQLDDAEEESDDVDFSWQEDPDARRSND